jgi:hypothetical protein
MNVASRTEGVSGHRVFLCCACSAVCLCYDDITSVNAQYLKIKFEHCISGYEGKQALLLPIAASERSPYIVES